MCGAAVRSQAGPSWLAHPVAALCAGKSLPALFSRRELGSSLPVSVTAGQRHLALLPMEGELTAARPVSEDTSSNSYKLAILGYQDENERFSERQNMGQRAASRYPCDYFISGTHSTVKSRPSAEGHSGTENQF